MEEWRDVVGYEGLYRVSSDGNIMSVNTYSHKKPIMMKLGKRPDGYLSVGLSKDGKTKTHTVHRIVAKAFIPNPNNYGYVNHKDENKSNNSVDNLEWCTKSYNSIYYLNQDERRKAEYANRFRDKNTGKSLSSWTTRVPHKYFEKIQQKDKDDVLLKVFDNSVQAAIAVGTRCNDRIIKVCKDNRERAKTGKRKRMAFNYVWEFAE